MMQEELGRPVASVFSSISEGPIAAASLGQVYKAVLRESGEAVAIKVCPASLCSAACVHFIASGPLRTAAFDIARKLHVPGTCCQACYRLVLVPLCVHHSVEVGVKEQSRMY